MTVARDDAARTMKYTGIALIVIGNLIQVIGSVLMAEGVLGLLGHDDYHVQLDAGIAAVVLGNGAECMGYVWNAIGSSPRERRIAVAVSPGGLRVAF